MSYLDRVFETSNEVVTIPNPVSFTGSVSFGSGGLTVGSGRFSLGTQANTSGSGSEVDSTHAGTLRVFSDDGGHNIADSVRGVQSRFLLTTAQSAGTIRALQGQLKVTTGTNVATGIYTGVQGYLELAGTHTSSAGATLSAIDASLETGGVTTATGEVFGLHVECTGAGSFSGSGTCAGIGITKGGTPVWPVGLFIEPLASVTAISVGTKANAVGSGVKIPATDDWGAVRIFTDDNDASIAKNVRALQSRTLLHASQAGGSIRAIQGQFKVVDGVGFDTGVYATVQGYIELAGTHTVSSAGILSCFDASIEIGTALTATGYVAGFKAELTGAGTCAAGLDCGFLVTNASGAAVWTYGLYVEASAVDTGVYVGACTDGIKMVGTINSAINLSGVTPGTNAGGDQGSLIVAGTAGAKMLFATNYQQACLFHLKSTGGRFTGLEMNVYTEDEEPTSARTLRGIESIARSLANDGGGTNSMYAICGSVQILATRDAPIAGEKIVGGYFAYSVDAAAASYAGSAFVLYLETGSGKNCTQGDFVIKMISNNAAATPLTAFITSAGGASYFMEFDNVQTPANGMAWNYRGAVSGTQAGWFKVRTWNGSSWTDGYVPFYPAGATS